VAPVKLRRTKATFIFGASIDIGETEGQDDPTTLSGLPSKLEMLDAPQMTEKSDEDGAFLEVCVPERFPPGSVLILATEMAGMDAKLDRLCVEGAAEAFARCNLVDLNVVLFRADGAERDVTNGEIGAYEVPGIGTLPYCGLEGWMHPLRHIMRFNDLGHPLCGHLRDGKWASDYVVNRLER
jgi:glycogen debranching enzyme